MANLHWKAAGTSSVSPRTGGSGSRKLVLHEACEVLAARALLGDVVQHCFGNSIVVCFVLIQSETTFLSWSHLQAAVKFVSAGSVF